MESIASLFPCYGLRMRIFPLCTGKAGRSMNKTASREKVTEVVYHLSKNSEILDGL